MKSRTMHILIAGSGPMLPQLTRQFHSQGHRVSLLVSEAREADELSLALKADVYSGDATDPEVLAEIWTEAVDMVLALTSSDHNNLGICRFAQIQFGVERVFALATNPENVTLFARLGVESFSPTLIVAQMIEQRSISEAVRNLTPVAGGQLLMTEYLVAPSDAVCGSFVREAGLPEDVLIVCIMRESSPLLPRGDTRIIAGDTLTIITTPSRQNEALGLLAGK